MFASSFLESLAELQSPASAPEGVLIAQPVWYR